jgi:hypothetical protein
MTWFYVKQAFIGNKHYVICSADLIFAENAASGHRCVHVHAAIARFNCGHQDNEIRKGRTPISKGGGWIAENSKAHAISLLTRRAKTPNAECFEACQIEALNSTPSNVPQR